MDNYARLLGLERASPEFREQLSRSIDMWLSCATTDDERASEHRQALRKDALRKEGLQISKNALKVSARLREWAAGVASAMDLESIEFDRLIEEAQHLERLSEIIRSHAHHSKSRKPTGRREFVLFGALILLLGLVYKDFTGRQPRVTYNNYRKSFEGTFVRFLEALWPKTFLLSRASGISFEYPRSKQARGAYVYKMTRNSKWA